MAVQSNTYQAPRLTYLAAAVKGQREVGIFHASSGGEHGGQGLADELHLVHVAAAPGETDLRDVGTAGGCHTPILGYEGGAMRLERVTIVAKEVDGYDMGVCVWCAAVAARPRHDETSQLACSTPCA